MERQWDEFRCPAHADGRHRWTIINGAGEEESVGEELEMVNALAIHLGGTVALRRSCEDPELRPLAATFGVEGEMFTLTLEGERDSYLLLFEPTQFLNAFNPAREQMRDIALASLAREEA